MASEDSNSGATGQTEKTKDYVKTYGDSDKNEDYGFYFFPEREKGKIGADNSTFFGSFTGVFKFRKDKTIRCIYNKNRCIQSSKYFTFLYQVVTFDEKN